MARARQNLPLIERKERLQRLFKEEIGGLRYGEHVAGDGPSFRAQAYRLGLEGAISKQADRPYTPGDRGIWVKSKRLNREEFVVVGWTDPECSRSHIGALLLHWVRPEVVVEVTYLTWTEDNLLRQASYQIQQEDKPARQLVRVIPHPPRA